MRYDLSMLTMCCISITQRGKIGRLFLREIYYDNHYTYYYGNTLAYYMV